METFQTASKVSRAGFQYPVSDFYLGTLASFAISLQTKIPYLALRIFAHEDPSLPIVHLYALDPEENRYLYQEELPTTEEICWQWDITIPMEHQDAFVKALETFPVESLILQKAFEHPPFPTGDLHPGSQGVEANQLYLSAEEALGMSSQALPLPYAIQHVRAGRLTFLSTNSPPIESRMEKILCLSPLEARKLFVHLHAENWVPLSDIKTGLIKWNKEKFDPTYMENPQREFSIWVDLLRHFPHHWTDSFRDTILPSVRLQRLFASMPEIYPIGPLPGPPGIEGYAESMLQHRKSMALIDMTMTKWLKTHYTLPSESWNQGESELEMGWYPKRSCKSYGISTYSWRAREMDCATTSLMWVSNAFWYIASLS